MNYYYYFFMFNIRYIVLQEIGIIYNSYEIDFVNLYSMMLNIIR